jgi:hypothetical protein
MLLEPFIRDQATEHLLAAGGPRRVFRKLAFRSCLGVTLPPSRIKFLAPWTALASSLRAPLVNRDHTIREDERAAKGWETVSWVLRVRTALSSPDCDAIE